MKRTILAGAALLSLTFAVSAHATNYAWAFSDTHATLDGAGTLTTSNTEDALGGYNVTSFTGDLFAPAFKMISGLYPDAASPATATYTYSNGDYWTYNNVLYNPASPHVDDNGILFSAGQLFNIFNSTGVNGQDTLSYHDAGGGFTNIEGTFAVTNLTSAVPEPSVWIMMLSGIAMMGAALRFGRRRTAVAFAA